MFLDPTPIGHKRDSGGPPSPFFASQTPIQSPREQSWRIKRSPLQEHTAAFNDRSRRSTSTGEDGKSTVRLVNHSPVSTPKKGTNSEHVLSRDQESAAVDSAQPHTSLLANNRKPASASETGSPAASRVSDEATNLTRAQRLDLPPVVTLLPSITSKLAPDPSRTRRSTSSKYSGSVTSTTTDGIDSTFSFSDSGRTARLSDRSTLYEDDIPEIDDEDDHEKSKLSHLKPSALETVPETTPEYPTAPFVSSTPKGRDSDTSRELQSHPPTRDASRPYAYPTSLSHVEQPDSSPQDSLESLPARSLSLPRSPPVALEGQDSQETLAYDLHDYSEASSGNFIAYSSNSSSSSPQYTDSPLHNASSYGSIQSRLGSSHTVRPDNRDSASPNGSPRSHQRSPSADSLPPLHVPRRRDFDQSYMTPQSQMTPQTMDSPEVDYEEIDLEPWPRQPFSSHLSTIASESDRAMSPAQFSHFSMGSGVLTIDDACSIPMSSTMSLSRHSGHLSAFSMSRRASEPLQSPSRKSSPVLERSDEELGDMTLGVFRAESAKPEPLFRGRQVTPGGDIRYDGPLPPLPPMPRSRNGEENEDRLSALSAPSLKKKRSGYSVRGRSNSTPSGGSRQPSIISYADSDRWSKGSSLFPVWAKNFYGGYAALMSASKISLHNPPTPPKARETAGHVRNYSQWSQRSITSRLGTGYSEIENASPTSSHFLPSIFRPRTRTAGTGEVDIRTFRWGKAPKKKPSIPLQDDPSPTDSMAITSDPYPNQQGDDTLPSGHPKFGELKDNSQNQGPMPPLPRKYSKQKLWDEMSFPRPMTKDRLSDFKLNPDQDSPHLRPNNNREQQLPQWRSPSFVESLDTLFSSRGNRQILLFALGFLCPLFWLLGALLPLPPRHFRDAIQAEKALPSGESEETLSAVILQKHSGGDGHAKWDEEKVYLKAKWWRTLNRVMCVVGICIIGAIIALAIIATK
ncbi:hypothetical protein Q7P37_010453 [Cladosporium fusiforme]